MHVLGGQWDRMAVAAFPVTHPSLAVVLVFRVEYTEALEEHALSVQLMKDGELKGVGAFGQLMIGHPPGMARGASQSMTAALTFPLVTFETPGRYEWSIAIDDVPLGFLPLEVIEITKMPGFPRFPGGTPGSAGQEGPPAEA